MQFFILFLTGIVLFYSFQYFPFFSIFISLLISIYLSLKKRFLLILVLLLGIAFAFVRYEPVKDILSLSKDDISGKEFAVIGVFESYPIETDRSTFKQTLNIKSAVNLKTGKKLKELTRQRVTLFSDKEFESGTECELVIKFLKDRTRLNPGEQNKGDLYANLLDIYDTGDKRISVHTKIQEYRHRLNRYFEENFKKDSGAFIASITTGQRDYMNEELRDAFNVAGLAHILSISGTHFGLFSVALFGIFRLLLKTLPYKILQRITIFLTPSQSAALFCLPFMLAYLGLSGGSIPAVRSFIMIGLFLLGLIIGRKGFWLNSLLFAAFMLTVWEPEVLFQLSFQLSFLAVLFIGVSLGSREDEKRGLVGETGFPPRIRRVFGYLKNGLLLTLSASIGTAPLVAYHFHYFSIISPISNLFIAPLIGFILIPLSVISSFLFLITGHFVFTPIVSAVSDASISLVKILSDVPFADIKIPAFPPIIVLLFYAGFIFYFLFNEPSRNKTNKCKVSHSALDAESMDSCFRRNDSLDTKAEVRGFTLIKKKYTLIIPFVPVLLYLFISILEKHELGITYLDVAQGDSSVIELPDRKTIVVDTGRTGRETTSFLRYRGITTIDALILSHIHPDHTSGLGYLLERFEVKELWDNGRLILPDTFSYVRHGTLNRGDLVEGRGYRIYALHPYPEFYSMYGNEYVEANNDSLVVKIDGNDKSFLFTGDIEKEAEENIAHLGRWLKSTVIKVPHHGGKTSLYKPFFEAVSPDAAVISVGRDNTFGHPHEETLDTLRGVSIFRTDHDGAIKIRESAKELEIKTYKDFQFGKARSFADEKKNIKWFFQTW